MPEFFRQQTQEEKQEFKPLVIQKDTAQKVFRRKLEKVQQSYFEKHKPFCARCAKFDFKDVMDRKVKEYERTHGHADFDKIKADLDDLDEYGKESRFKFIKDRDAMEPLGVADFSKGHVQRQIKIGIHKEFRCKVRDCGVDLFIPTDEVTPVKPVKVAAPAVDKSDK